MFFFFNWVSIICSYCFQWPNHAKNDLRVVYTIRKLVHDLDNEFVTFIINCLGIGVTDFMEIINAFKLSVQVKELIGF